MSNIECAFCNKSDDNCIFCNNKQNENMSEKNKELIKKFISLEIKEQLSKELKKYHPVDKLIKSNNFSFYKDIFAHPISLTIKIDKSTHNEFKNTFTKYTELIRFLDEICYEPYINYCDIKNDSVDKLKGYCNDYYRFIGIYLTYQSYINGLKLKKYTDLFDGPFNGTKKQFEKNKIPIDDYTINLIRNYDVRIKYDITINKNDTPLSFTYGYDKCYEDADYNIKVYTKINSIK
jgi:hypothetical protein